ncbi:nitronate monooxygenase [Gordonia sp. PDNC005]|uniref:NAD(P)H-dependent flavin oxidoreductase n=1 Tax=Gordonia sp. PDNC005 TaxID=2811424 RepID=UPI00196658C7|nr:nitronate monooxygenase [Gordonia sp. PDNC005]QRY63540.1 nitronate monooxygenase [Gordonia sp. PDNC005]
MYSFTDDLRVPIVGAPMAGGTSTPALTAAVSEAGGFGFHGGAYVSPETLRADVRSIRELTDQPFGVNLFVPEQVDVDDLEFAAYRERLTPLAERAGVDLPESVPFTDDAFDAKIDVLIAERVPVVSFTFGLPDRNTIDRLHDAEIAASSTVTSIDEAHTATERGVDSLCAQGFSAGGHRAMFRIHDADPQVDTLDLVRAVVPLGLPVVGAGGVATPLDVEAILEAGAVAAQVGTLLLRTPEAGTRQAHKDALADPRFTRTVTTRAYSGRLARGLENDFIRTNDGHAPLAYPQVNTLTGGIRKASESDADVINLWAGSGFREARAVSVAEVISGLTPQAPNRFGQ